jgi:hypothetical protein
MSKKVALVAVCIAVLCIVCSKNEPPVITSISVNPDDIYPNEEATLTVNAEDPDGDELAFTWSATSGNLSSTSGQVVDWKAPGDPGSYTVTVVAEDEAEAADTASKSIRVESNPDTEPPTVTLTYPANNDTIQQPSITITADATDNVGVSRVEFYVDNGLIGTDNTAPYTCSWSIVSYQDSSSHSIYAKAYDAANNSAQSNVVTVTVVNRGWVWDDNDADLPIYDLTWTYDYLYISGAPSQGVVDTVWVYTDIVHPYPSDLVIQLRSPDNNVWVMWNRDYPGGAQWYWISYFEGETVNGTWTLEIFDADPLGEGYIDYCLVEIEWKYQ